MEEKDYIKVYKATFIIMLFSLFAFLILTIVYQTKYDNQLEISQKLCELSNTQSEVIETLYPYFEEEVCSVSEILCNNISRITIPEKFNCEDLK